MSPAGATRVRNSPAFQALARAQAAKPAFSKPQAYYTKTFPLKALTCAACPWFQSEARACILVASQGKPSDGAILPGGACSLWGAGPARIRAFEALYGRGAGQRGVAPQVLRGRVEHFAWEYQDPADVP